MNLWKQPATGDYIPSWFNTDEILPDAHEDSEDRYLRSLDKYDEIRARFETEFIDVTEDNDVEEARISRIRRVLRRVQDGYRGASDPRE